MSVNPSSVVTSVPPFVSLEIIVGGARLANKSVSRPIDALAPELVDGSPFSFQFTGRHDAGILPVINSTGHYALLLECVAEAKNIADAALTNDIATATTTGVAKKPRIQGGEE